MPKNQLKNKYRLQKYPSNYLFPVCSNLFTYIFAIRYPLDNGLTFSQICNDT